MASRTRPHSSAGTGVLRKAANAFVNRSSVAPWARDRCTSLRNKCSRKSLGGNAEKAPFHTERIHSGARTTPNPTNPMANVTTSSARSPTVHGGATLDTVPPAIVHATTSAAALSERLVRFRKISTATISAGMIANHHIVNAALA